MHAERNKRALSPIDMHDIFLIYAEENAQSFNIKDDKSGHWQESLCILSKTEQKNLADNCRTYTPLRSCMA